MREAYLVSSEPRVIGAEELRARLPMPATIDALEDAFRSRDPSGGPLRTHVETPNGALLMMPAAEEGVGVGVKLVSLTPENPARGLPFIHASYVLFDAETQAPIAVLDGAALTALRTAAVSGLATRCLARADASRLVLRGGRPGGSAPGRDAGRPTDRARHGRVAVHGAPRRRSPGGPPRRASTPWSVSRTRSPGRISSARARPRPSPLRRLAPGGRVPRQRDRLVSTAHSGAGHRDDAPRTDRRGVQGRRAGRGRGPADPDRGGAIGAGHVVADLAEVARGAEVRRSAEDVTVFEGVGMAFEDLVVAKAVVDTPS